MNKIIFRTTVEGSVTHSWPIKEKLTKLKLVHLKKSLLEIIHSSPDEPVSVTFKQENAVFNLNISNKARAVKIIKRFSTTVW